MMKSELYVIIFLCPVDADGAHIKRWFIKKYNSVVSRTLHFQKEDILLIPVIYSLCSHRKNEANEKFSHISCFGPRSIPQGLWDRTDNNVCNVPHRYVRPPCLSLIQSPPHSHNPVSNIYWHIISHTQPYYAHIYSICTYSYTLKQAVLNADVSQWHINMYTHVHAISGLSNDPASLRIVHSLNRGPFKLMFTCAHTHKLSH